MIDLIAFTWVLWPAIGMALARDRGHPAWNGFLAGLLFGPCALFYLASRSNFRACPHCHGWAWQSASVCRECGREIGAATRSDSRGGIADRPPLSR